MAIGLSAYLPLTRDTEDGIKLNKNYIELVRQNFKNLLLTVPGERIMMPEFGVGLRRYLFEPVSQKVKATISSKIMEQAGKYMPFISIDKITFTSFEDNPNFPINLVSMKIQYKIIPLEKVDLLTLETDPEKLIIIDTTNI